jgi:hypothetical protein
MLVETLSEELILSPAEMRVVSALIRWQGTETYE